MDCKKLYTFLNVASNMNMTQVGENMGYSQSTISSHIKQLEDELGIQLFDRVGRGIQLTQYGRDLIPYARQAVNSMEELYNFVNRDLDLKGVITIGMVESLFRTIFKELIINFEYKYPNIKVKVIVESTSSLKEMIAKNIIDAACLIDSDFNEERLRCAYSKNTDICLVVGKDHRLAGKNISNFKDVIDEKFILMEETAPYNVVLKSIMYQNNLEIIPFLTLQSCEMAIKLVAADEYISFLPRYTFKKYLEEGSVKEVHYDSLKVMQSVQILYSESKFITPQLNAFILEAEGVMDDMLN